MLVRRVTAIFVSSFLLVSPPCEAGAPELERINRAIAECYSEGKLESAKPLYERALQILQSSGNQTLLNEARANYAKLLKRIEDKNNPSGAAAASRHEACTSYINEVSQLVRESWAETNPSHRAPLTVQFSINKQGAISGLKLAPGSNASSQTMYDAYGAVMKVAPFALLPAGVPQLSVRIQLNGEFKHSIQADSTDHSNGVVSLGQGTREVLLERLWKLKNSGKNEASVDGALVELADPTAIRSLSMLSHARPTQLLKAKEFLEKEGNAKDIARIDQLYSSRPTVLKEEHLISAHFIAKSDFKNALGSLERLWMAEKTADNLYYLINCHRELGNLEVYMVGMEEFCKRFPMDERAKAMPPRIAYYKNEFAEIRTKEATNFTSDQPHFLKREMPLTVYIPDIPNATMSWRVKPDASIDFRSIVLRTLERWKQATNGVISFIPATDRSSALIEVEWIGSAASMNHSFAAGTAGFESKPGRGKVMSVDLLVIGSHIDAEEFYETTLHEFGHVLGLSHSSQPGDIMYWSGVNTEKVRDLSQNDVNRAKDLYR